MISGHSENDILRRADDLVKALTACFSGVNYISPFVSTLVIRSFNEMMYEIKSFIIKRKFKREQTMIANVVENAPNVEDQYNQLLGIQPKLNRILNDFEKFMNPFTVRNFFIFIDSELSENQKVLRAVEDIVKSLKETDRLSIVKVSKTVDTILPL